MNNNIKLKPKSRFFLIISLLFLISGFQKPEINAPQNFNLKHGLSEGDSVPCYVSFNVSKRYTHKVDLTYGSDCSKIQLVENESADISYRVENYKTIGSSLSGSGFSVGINGDDAPNNPVSGVITYSKSSKKTTGCCAHGVDKMKSEGSGNLKLTTDDGSVFSFQYDGDTKQGSCSFGVKSLEGVSFTSSIDESDCDGNSSHSDASAMGQAVLESMNIGIQVNNFDNPANEYLEPVGLGGRGDFSQTSQGYTMNFSSSHTTHSKLDEGWTGTDDITYEVSVSATISYHQKFTAYLEPNDGWESYKKWLPEGNIKDEQRKPGNDVTFKIRIVDNEKPNETANVEIKELTYTLTEISNIPGVCDNYPADDPDVKADMSLVDPENPENDETTEIKLKEMGIARINSYDFGGTARLTAKVQLKSGEVLIAESSDDHKNYVNLPLHADDSHTADYWKKMYKSENLPDDDDNEKSDMNIGNDYPGDGYTLFEEYRGFRENKKHIRTSPKERDLMILDNAANKDRTENGIMLYTTVTDITTHSRFKEEEFGRNKPEPGLEDSAAAYQTSGIKHDKVMNFNNEPSLHSVDQHGLLILSSPKKIGFAAAIQKSKYPETPKGFYFLVITQDFNPNKLNDSGYSYIRGTLDTNGKFTVDPGGKSLLITDEYARAVAHEMLHCSHVMHHGENDLKNQKVYRSGNSIYFMGKPITLRWNDDEGTEIKANEDFWNANNDTITLYWIGVQGGQHSGMENCIMRYDCATAFMSKDKSTIYLLMQDNFKGLKYQPINNNEFEASGTDLCGSSEGTGVNSADASPRCRFGNADKGDCKSQVCINDKYQF